jgi:hypothetical protein
MKIFELFYYYRLRDETHAAFQADFDALLNRYGVDTLGIGGLYRDVYKPLYDEELLVLDIFLESPLTREIVKSERVRYEVLRGFAAAARAACFSPDPETRAAGKHFRMLLKHYGNITRRNYDDKSAAVDDLLRELDLPENEPLVIAAGLEKWVEHLREANATFVDLMRARNEEVSLRPDRRAKEVRVDVDKAMLEMLTRVEALVTLHGMTSDVADYAPFVAGWNALAGRYRLHLAQEQGRRDAARERGEEFAQDFDVEEEFPA